MSGTTNKVPPDGGYGWIVTLAYALNNVVVLPLIANFGLVFRVAASDTELTATQGAMVLILNHSIGMLLSFFGGPILSRFGYRKVAVVGALFISGGLFMTAFASYFWVFIITYSIINSIGIAAVMSSFTLAINSFFKDKRGRAIGVGMSLTGLGAIFTPLAMGALVEAYGWRYAVLILSAICGHSLVAACLLRPAKWYLRDPPHIEEMVPLNTEATTELINGNLTNSTSQNGVPSLPQLEESVENGVAVPISVSMRSLASAASLETRNAVSHPDIRRKSPQPHLAESRYKWWESQEINLGSSINIFNEPDVKKSDDNNKEKKENSIFRKFVELFDLTLLSDPIFVNILVGLSVAACVETNFSLLFPFILNDILSFETKEIAIITSVIGLSDTLFRLVSPFIGEWCNKSPRVMFMVSLVLIVFIRTIMLFTTTFLGMVFVALAMGVTKGVRTVYMNIVIPSYVPIERLPFASGIQMFVNSITIVTIGTLLGRIREGTGSFKIPIVVLNIVTSITVVLWSVEFLYVKYKKKDTTVKAIPT